jgi:hypothetical protein
MATLEHNWQGPRLYTPTAELYTLNWEATFFRGHPYIRSTTVLHDVKLFVYIYSRKQDGVKDTVDSNEDGVSLQLLEGEHRQFLALWLVCEPAGLRVEVHGVEQYAAVRTREKGEREEISKLELGFFLQETGTYLMRTVMGAN